MKLNGILLSLLFLLSPFGEAVTLLSDFDDTIKRSNIPNIWPNGTINSVIWKKAYTGMPEFFKAMESEINGLYILSASPLIIKPIIKAFLESYDIDYIKIYTRGFFASQKKALYKIEKIEEVLATNNDRLILIGDDVEADHEIYLKVAKRNPGRIEQIYIHNVINRELPKDITSYFTAYDLAVHEYKKERLTYNKLQIIAHKIITTKMAKMYQIIPKHAYCPTKLSELNDKVPLELALLTTAVNTKIISYCSAFQLKKSPKQSKKTP